MSNEPMKRPVYNNGYIHIGSDGYSHTILNLNGKAMTHQGSGPCGTPQCNVMQSQYCNTHKLHTHRYFKRNDCNC